MSYQSLVPPFHGCLVIVSMNFKHSPVICSFIKRLTRHANLCKPIATP